MSVNSSSSDGVPICSSTYTTLCLALVYIALLLPLSITVLYLGFQRWKQKRSVPSAGSMSFSDFFTYNMAVMELIGVLGYIISLCGTFTGFPLISWVGFFIGVFPWNGQMLFPMFTSAEHYLAVVQPITYLRLKQRIGVRIRNISTMCAWFNCCVGVGFLLVTQNLQHHIFIPSVCYLALLLLAMIFCSLSVLRVLIRPRPGEAGGDRVGVDQSKRKAFKTILIIMGVLLLRFGGNLVCNVVLSLPSVSYHVKCVVGKLPALFNLPSSLVLPLMFLHRAGKLPGCRQN